MMISMFAYRIWTTTSSCGFQRPRVMICMLLLNPPPPLELACAKCDFHARRPRRAGKRGQPLGTQCVTCCHFERLCPSPSAGHPRFTVALAVDADGSGTIDKDEFRIALTNMQGARAWLRYCPTCLYENTCEYCETVQDSCNNFPEFVERVL